MFHTTSMVLNSGVPSTITSLIPCCRVIISKNKDQHFPAGSMSPDPLSTNLAASRILVPNSFLHKYFLLKKKTDYGRRIARSILDTVIDCEEAYILRNTVLTTRSQQHTDGNQCCLSLMLV